MEKGMFFEQLSQREQGFLNFIDRMSKVPARIEVMLEQVSEALAVICPQLGIGKVELTLDSPANKLYPNGLSGRRMLFSGGVVDVFHPYVQRFITEEGGELIIEFYKKDNATISEEEDFWIAMIARMLYLFMGRARISSMLRMSMEIDQGTGLPNVAEYLRRMAELIERGVIMDYAACFFNIRNFQYINKLVNYQSGDEVMCQYAGKAAALMKNGEVLARLGGDNYVALVKKQNLETFLDGLDALTVDVAVHSGVRTVSLPARVGIYEIDRAQIHPGEVMLNISVAQQICREGKGRTRVYYSQEMSQEVLYEKKVSLDFNKALEEGQFRAYYQPKVDLSNGRLCGAEALARWERKGEVLLPGRFVPMLEKDGAICRLDFEMLRQTCEMISTWIAKGLTPLVISINMSRWHLREADFVDEVCKVLQEYQVDPKWIEIEVTETVDYEEYQTMISVLTRLQEKGFSTAIDDFGSGYSSLTMLHKMDVDVIKLDQGFIWEQTEKGNIMVRNLIRMAKELGIKVLAEGVETVEQRDFLTQSGCDMAQGFLYAMPLKKEEFERRAFS
ncbi:MAG: GGDEF domain-containing phosphodiesterase [Lachnospiraceae bacterium]|nr:GGDEF domain-containing phosphodiesterase [Lachnospiraceae bacterium]